MLYGVQNVIDAIGSRVDLLPHFVYLSVVKSSLTPGRPVGPTLMSEMKQSF